MAANVSNTSQSAFWSILSMTADCIASLSG